MQRLNLQKSLKRCLEAWHSLMTVPGKQKGLTCLEHQGWCFISTGQDMTRAVSLTLLGNDSLGRYLCGPG